jgi:hypothetical protein
MLTVKKSSSSTWLRQGKSGLPDNAGMPPLLRQGIRVAGMEAFVFPSQKIRRDLVMGKQ